MKKFIKRAILELVTNRFEDGARIECDVEFALAIQREDLIWILNEEKYSLSELKERYKFITDTDENCLKGLGFGGIYAVIARDIIGDTIELNCLETQGPNGSFSERFKHLELYDWDNMLYKRK